MKKKYRSGEVMGYILLIALLLGIGGFLTGVFSIGGDGDSAGTQTTPAGDAIQCSSDVTPDVNFKAYDVDNKGTAVTENFIYRKVGDIVWTAGTLGTEITDMEVGATYEIVYGLDASAGIDNPYGEMFQYTVPCLSDSTVTKGVYNDEVEASVSFTFYNADNNAAAETFSAGQTQIVRLQVYTGNDEAYGNPYLDNPNVLILKLNSSEWDKPEEVYLEDGTKLASTSVPQRYDIEALSGTDFTQYAYEFPAVLDTPTNVYLRLNADDSNAPTVDGTAYLFAGTYYINEESDISIGVETEEGADVATSDPDSVTLDFT